MNQRTIPQTFALAVRQHQAGRLHEAQQLYQQILARQPNHAEAMHLLGAVAHQLGRHDIAVKLIRWAIALKPDNHEAYYNLGHALKAQGHLNEAIAAYRQATILKASFPAAHNNLGIALKAAGQLDQAIAAFRQSIAQQPNCTEAHSNLGIALGDAGCLDEAIAAGRQAIALDPHPETSEGFSVLLFALYHQPNCDARRLLEETRQWARKQCDVAPAGFPNWDRNPERKLKIGYLSPFFNVCADAHFILPLLAHHNKALVEVFGYSYSSRPDDLTERVRSHCDHWIDIRQLDLQKTVELMRSHQLDILVNISKPADECRRIVASRIAPVQIVWLIFASCTSGLPTVDYRIADSYVDPAGTDEGCYSERTVRLPQTAWCYHPLTEAIPVGPLPAVSNGYVTFGSLNRLLKINPAVVVAWARILRAAPNSRLCFLADVPSTRQRLLDQFQQAGVDRGRIEFINKLPRPEYLQQYHRLDILLDTFPYSGHTTALDSLWMGVPLVTCAGATAVGRAAASALQNLGLAELIGRTPEEYVETAVKLANNLPRLQELRATLRRRMEASPLMDAPRFARQMEAAYRQMWRKWCTV